MPQMGRPVTLRERAFSNVRMAPKETRPKPNQEMTARQKQNLLNKITGYKEKSIYSDKDKTIQVLKSLIIFTLIKKRKLDTNN